MLNTNVSQKNPQVERDLENDSKNPEIGKPSLTSLAVVKMGLIVQAYERLFKDNNGAETYPKCPFGTPITDFFFYLGVY